MGTGKLKMKTIYINFNKYRMQKRHKETLIPSHLFSPHYGNPVESLVCAFTHVLYAHTNIKKYMCTYVGLLRIMLYIMLAF